MCSPQLLDRTIGVYTREERLQIHLYSGNELSVNLRRNKVVSDKKIFRQQCESWSRHSRNVPHLNKYFPWRCRCAFLQVFLPFLENEFAATLHWYWYSGQGSENNDRMQKVETFVQAANVAEAGGFFSITVHLSLVILSGYWCLSQDGVRMSESSGV